MLVVAACVFIEAERRWSQVDLLRGPVCVLDLSVSKPR